MSTAEPFMPAHEARPAEPPQDHDLDHDTDVIFDEAGSDGADVDPQPWHTDDTAPTLPRPVPGAHLTAEELAADFEADEPATDRE
ncbi:hypothetical protein JNB63_04630 [Microbacterium trichothecenolyticum]|uniref:hypothetical protein n=1 Tax=Microbacterium trichothecenolyticum TaxID=69370 RepID=UPI001C6E93CB|nr:hypothetical protein [Microbacterium trichothecenolyticum]MBW9119371.1 hypothetical protein [Microbacterium trichothecenolyticum]